MVIISFVENLVYDPIVLYIVYWTGRPDRQARSILSDRHRMQLSVQWSHDTADLQSVIWKLFPFEPFNITFLFLKIFMVLSFMLSILNTTSYKRIWRDMIQRFKWLLRIGRKVISFSRKFMVISIFVYRGGLFGNAWRTVCFALFSPRFMHYL